MHFSIRTSGQLGPALKKLRKAKKWSQGELGSRIGLSQERVSVIENHPEKVTFDALLTILMALEAEFLVAGIAPQPQHGPMRAAPLKHKESW
jgi:HTH-type transcriptional regulator / antitoxin HipB